jgi:hypothetical protein
MEKIDCRHIDERCANMKALLEIEGHWDLNFFKRK